MKFTRYGLLVRKIRIGNGDSVEMASKKIGVSERMVIDVEDKGYPPPLMFDVKFRQTYPQNEDMSGRLRRLCNEDMCRMKGEGNK